MNASAWCKVLGLIAAATVTGCSESAEETSADEDSALSRCRTSAAEADDAAPMRGSWLGVAPARGNYLVSLDLEPFDDKGRSGTFRARIGTDRRSFFRAVDGRYTLARACADTPPRLSLEWTETGRAGVDLRAAFDLAGEREGETRFRAKAGPLDAWAESFVMRRAEAASPEAACRTDADCQPATSSPRCGRWTCNGEHVCELSGGRRC